MQQVVRGSRGARPGPHAHHAGGGEGALDGVGLEPLVEQVAHRHGHHPKELVYVALLQSGRAAGLAHERKQVTGSLGPERRRRAQHQRAQELRHLGEQRLEAVVCRGVLSRVGLDRAARGRRVIEEQDRPAIRRKRAEGGIERHRLVAEARELEVGDHLGLEHRHHVGGARHALSGPDLLGHACPAQDVAALEHARVEPGAGQISGAGEPVVPAADDDRVVAQAATCMRSPASARTSRRVETMNSNSSGPATSGGEI